ncbi:aldehyde dehydrogenase family protein [Phenylobacterium sp.]|uniref:aldehyde dehydrogenase family protein n=1 Tax=Phenylobacterium sp. TaxID=1871053 RepID=UPI0037849DBF
MSDSLPRVTYSNFNVDLAPVHAKFDRELPDFERHALGQTYGAIIGGDRNVLSGRLTEEASPIDRDIRTGRFPYATADLVDAAFAAAAAKRASWSSTEPARRLALIRRFADIVHERRYSLAMAALYEVGKSRIEAIGEAEESVDLPRYYADEFERRGGFVQDLNRVREEESTESRLLPFGVFAVIAPFNFPLALSINMISAALITGNCVVFKPAEGCSLTGRMMVDAALDAGIPPGVVNLVYGDGATGELMVKHALADGVAFTGSHAVGMQIARTALSGPYAKPVIAEMGGKNPAYVTASADIATAAEGVARSAFGLQGQKCSACSVAYVDERIYADFAAALVEFTAGLPIGDPRSRGAFIGAVHTEATLARFEAAVTEARRTGRVLHGGARVVDGQLARGLFVEPAIVEVPAGSRLVQEELFMPFLALRPMTSLEAGLAEGNAVAYGLSAGIYARDEAEVQYFLNNVQAGVVYANRSSGATTGAWPGVQSFCGWKGSGVSHKGGLGPYFLPQFMREQSRTLMRAPAEA